VRGKRLEDQACLLRDLWTQRSVSFDGTSTTSTVQGSHCYRSSALARCGSAVCQRIFKVGVETIHG